MKILIPIVLFLLSFAGAWLIPNRPESNPEAPITRSSSARNQNPLTSHPKGALEKFIAIANLPSPEDRVQNAIALASTIPIDQLQNWLTSVNLATLDNSLRTLFLAIACDRWLEAAPADLILWNSRTDLVNSHHYLAHWLTKDRESATNYLLTKPTGFHAGYSMSQTIQNLARMDFNLAFDLTKEQYETSLQNGSNGGPTLLALAQADLAAFIALSPTLPDSAKQHITPTIVGSLLASDFSAAIAHIKDHQDGPAQLLASQHLIAYRQLTEILVAKHQELPDGWLQEILDQGSLNPTSKTLPWLELGPTQLGITEEAFAKLLAQQGRIDFGRENRARILTLLDNPDLPFAARSRFLTSQFNQWLNEGSAQLESQLSRIQDPKLREQSQRMLETLQSREAADLNKPTLGHNIGENLLWTPAQTQNALASFKTATPEEQRATFLNVGDNLDMRGSNYAFVSKVISTIATQVPPSEPKRGDEDLQTTSVFATNWAIESPATAAAWVRELPAGDHRLWAAKNVAQVWQQYSPSEASSWIKTLPAKEQSEIKTFLAR